MGLINALGLRLLVLLRPLNSHFDEEYYDLDSPVLFGKVYMSYYSFPARFRRSNGVECEREAKTSLKNTSTRKQSRIAMSQSMLLKWRE